MASKQLGKLRQWAGEVISSREKTQPTAEFLDLERDIELRRAGIDRLEMASEDYCASLSRKKFSEALSEPDKMMPIEALGAVMIAHGEEFGEDSAFGSSLVSFGRAHCRIATLHEAYALTLSDTFLTSLKQSSADLTEYTMQRKKLESRRLTYDAAITKAEKTYKKEKDRKEADEELLKAKSRYEEAAGDVRARMDAIREHEIDQLRELTGFLNVEMKFAEQYLEVMKEVKNEWVDESAIHKIGEPKPKTPFYSFGESKSQIADKKDAAAATTPGLASRFYSIRSFRSSHSKISNSADDHALSEPEPDSPVSPRSQRSKSDAGSVASRPSSRARRDRSNSATTVGSRDAGDEKERKKKLKKKSNVSGWVGGAMSSVTGKGKNKVPDKESFATLNDEDDSSGRDGESEGHKRPRSSLSNRSGRSSRSASVKGSPRSTARPNKGKKEKEKKMMKAVHDFSGSVDELSFKAGDEIIVLNEVLDGWWMGELAGRRGLFPTTYTEPVVRSGRKSPAPALPPRRQNASNSSILGLGSLVLNVSNTSSDDEESRETLVNGNADEEASLDGDGYTSSDVDEGHPFADHLTLARSPMKGAFYAESITGSVTDDDESLAVPGPEGHQFITAQVDDSLKGNPVHGKEHVIFPSERSAEQKLSRPSLAVVAPSVESASPVKKVPPPPPPRRPSTTQVLDSPPPLPARNTAWVRSRSQSSVPALSSISPSFLTLAPAHPHPRSADSSPFISQSELLNGDLPTGTTSKHRCEACGCNDFKQNPFQSQGVCASCSHPHS